MYIDKIMKRNANVNPEPTAAERKYNDDVINNDKIIKNLDLEQCQPGQ